MATGRAVVYYCRLPMHLVQELNVGTVSTVATFNFCNECTGNPGITDDRTPDCHPVSWAWMHGSPDNGMKLWFVHVSCVGHWCISFWYVIQGYICTTRHMQKSGRLVQELNVYQRRNSNHITLEMHTHQLAFATNHPKMSYAKCIMG